MKKTISAITTMAIVTLFIFAYYEIKNTPDYKTCDILFDAIKTGDLSSIKSIVEKDPKFVNFESSFYPLHKAALHCRTEIIEYLIKNGARVNAKCGRGNFTPLKVAAANCDDAEMIQILIDHGANVDERDDFQETPLMSAAERGNLDNIRILIKNGANVNARCRANGSVLENAIENRQQQAAQILIKHGAKGKTKYRHNNWLNKDSRKRVAHLSARTLDRQTNTSRPGII